uniref:GIIM domain-containing protein n=1 Tax=Mesocestoides corti TaxID=53468 RepID=A0A5K3F0X4_MESCO
MLAEKLFSWKLFKLVYQIKRWREYYWRFWSRLYIQRIKPLAIKFCSGTQ